MAGGTKILIGACLLTVFLAKNGAAAFIPHADLTGTHRERAPHCVSNHGHHRHSRYQGYRRASDARRGRREHGRWVDKAVEEERPAEKEVDLLLVSSLPASASSSPSEESCGYHTTRA
ncbi:hypothetical protein NSK_002075 [Nannochloropsis salina CCMP1776]|uniref:RxLR effector protein n=1 Tax=Nannochloropsis salina CCMP1776 TaxID=1027361 RepID=A0A4D9DCQ5_9STRA|nr:hypothetical protein NSK_002075 [Nannochloropsis salina CCMP1776]|eukprot:TFJ86418.1 hypothetical protein NSK_002075 [Nannochloropsis salina CCMP1776]